MISSACKEQLMAFLYELEGETAEQLVMSHKVNTYKVVSAIAYLIGVPRSIFENPNEPPGIGSFNKLEEDKNSRVIRNLCLLRTAIERNFGKINTIMNTEYRGLVSIPEYVPSECISQLAADGIYFKSMQKLFQYIIDINRLISDKINNCKGFFPIWITWEYIKKLFIMPDGLTEAGIKKAADEYYANKKYYPYQMYINWPPSNEGNILYCDSKFIKLLYHWNNDDFIDESKVSDASTFIKSSIYDFIEASYKTNFMVDCENSDPYRLCATLNNLDPQYLQKISKIILYDDVNAATAWEVLSSFTSVPIEHVLIERVNRGKSLVDIRMTAGTVREHYQNNVDSFVIVSSDSDFWGLIDSLPDARFLVMVEYEKTGVDIKNALSKSGIFYCYIDDFYSGNSDDIKVYALKREIRRFLETSIQVNVNRMLDEAFRATRITMSSPEKRQFYDRYVRSMYVEIDGDGNLSVQLKNK